MMDDFEYYRNLLKRPDRWPGTEPGDYTPRQVTLAKNSARILLGIAGSFAALKILQTMLNRDPKFYDAVMEKLEKEMNRYVGRGY